MSDTIYIYQADVYCEWCGAGICDELDKKGLAPEDPDDDYSYDSDDYPKECCNDSDYADTPQHCGECHRPLGTSLTADGVQYVLDHILESLEHPERWDAIIDDRLPYYKGSRWIEVERDWAEMLRWYGLNHRDKFLIDLFLDVTDELPQAATQPLGAGGATIGMPDDFFPPECETCEGTGRVKFCPSEPDKCSGCEELPCPDCQ